MIAMRLRTKIFLALLIAALTFSILRMCSRWRNSGEISSLDVVGDIIIVMAIVETIRGESKRSQH